MLLYSCPKAKVFNRSVRESILFKDFLYRCQVKNNFPQRSRSSQRNFGIEAFYESVLSEYSFENYRFQGRLLEWGDIISVTFEILKEFPTGSQIQITLSLSSPLNGSMLDEATVTLCGKPHPNANWGYHFQISNKHDFSTLVYDDVVSSPNLVIKNLMPGEYFWRMRGVKSGRQPGAWSETWSFTIATHGGGEQ